MNAIRSHELLFRGNELLIRRNELIIRGNELIIHENELKYLSYFMSSMVFRTKQYQEMINFYIVPNTAT